MFLRKLPALVVAIILVLVYVQGNPALGQEKIKSKYASMMQQEDKDAVLAMLNNIKHKLESGDSGYTLQSFLDEGSTETDRNVDLKEFGMYTIDVIEKERKKPESIHVHVPGVMSREPLPERHRQGRECPRSR